MKFSAEKLVYNKIVS